MTTTKLTAAQAVANVLEFGKDNARPIDNTTITTHAWKTVREAIAKMIASDQIIRVTNGDKYEYYLAGSPAAQTEDTAPTEPQTAEQTPAETTEPAPAAEIDPDKRASKMETVRKLLALAEHENTSPDEAEAASARAARLMLQFQIDEAEIRATAKNAEPAKIVERRIEIFGKGGYGQSRAFAMGDIAKGYGVKAVSQSLGGSKPSCLIIVGTEAQCDALEILIPSLLLQMENALRKSWKAKLAAAKADGYVWSDGELFTARYHASRAFFSGYGAGVAKRFRNLLNTETDIEPTPGAALVIQSDADRAAAELARLFPKIKLVDVKIKDEDAELDGYRAALEADIADADHRLNDTDTDRIAIEA